MTGGPVRGAAGSLLPALLFALLLAVSTCARVPKIIVLEDPLSADEHVTLGVTYEREGKLIPYGTLDAQWAKMGHLAIVAPGGGGR